MPKRETKHNANSTASNPTPFPQNMTVSEWLHEWLAVFCANRLKPLTLHSYVGIIENHIVPAIGNFPLREINGIHIQQLYNSMTDIGLSGKTVKNASSVLHKSFDVAIKQVILSVNPCDAAELPKVIRHEVAPLADEEIPLFLAAIENSPMKNAYTLCLFTGLREGECLGLSWEHVDFVKGRITVCQQLQKKKFRGGKYYIAPSTKNNKARTIEPPPIAFEYLRAEQIRQAENQKNAGSVWSNPFNLVFTNRTGKNFAIFTFYKEFKRIAAEIGRPDARPHDLRHTAATVAIASGADIKSVQSMLGHSAASFTLSVYAHTSRKMMKDTATRIQHFYDSLGSSGADDTELSIDPSSNLDILLETLARLVEKQASTSQEAAQLIRELQKQNIALPCTAKLLSSRF